MKVFLALAAVAFSVSKALALADDAICDEAALLAAQTHGVPPQVMLAITRVETGRDVDGVLQPWPWAVNQAGQSHWFDNADQAEAFIRDAADAGLSNLDIGCFQLNLRWHGDSFETVRGMLDPWRNADHAARFLLKNHERKGNWVDAVAAYHSETPEYAAVYVDKIERVLGLLEQVPISQDHEPLVPPRENRFPLLQPGIGMALASLVPSAPPRMPLFGPRPNVGGPP